MPTRVTIARPDGELSFTLLASRAGDRVRTGDRQLGKLLLYQLSYTRSVCRIIVPSVRIAILCSQLHELRLTRLLFRELIKDLVERDDVFGRSFDRERCLVKILFFEFTACRTCVTSLIGVEDNRPSPSLAT